ncbi:unnamed protein product [Adineta steineri]|uniref:Uncharacterized protein n=1 Tax=Adineta steineri TaxID=433720 RepID=A0A814SSP7_9BILA|nr:unnamed protein product [Adineta steineri]CAF1340005.1 unnamed protein product [Adineta steineri]
MPSPVVHISFALGFGTFIMTLTKGSFTAIHCLILSLNAFFGPDIGTFLGWCLSITFPALADQAMAWIHDSIGYIIIIAPIQAILCSKLSKKFIDWKYSRSFNNDLDDVNIEQINKNLISLNIKDCYLLAVAGCILHFQLDHIFEENGQNKLYLWILSTGYFTKPTPPFLPLSVIFVGVCTCTLFFGFAWIHLFSSTISKQTLTIKLKYTFSLFLAIFSIYISYLFISQIILGKKAVIGEEADLGVLTFIIIFHFLPFILCLLSIHN